jgi:hypothetical protein
MKAAHDSRAEAFKEAAVLRSLADGVVSPVVAGRKSRKGLTAKQKSDWSRITEIVLANPVPVSTSQGTAEWWKADCKAAGIGAGFFGWFLWNWAFPLLIELAKLWIESRRNSQSSECE